ncbi:MAG: NAD(P)/FAD-dependent oxidoreductase [Actinomycetota bacterium]|nr:NAD(P)/FAD-dependent oxidoreductase [Actinomycetota bacterium]
MTHDAVVVGAGHNGLVAANLLADAGWDVLVIEASDSPGGAVRSAEITAPGYLSDLCSAFYPLGLASPVIRDLDLPAHGLQWRHAPAVLAHVLPDDRCVVLSRDLDRTAASVETFAPGDGDAWRATFAQWQRFGPALLDSLLGPFPPVRGGLRTARALGIAGLLRGTRYALLPVRRLAAELFAGAGAQLLLAGNAAHTDLGPESAGGSAFGWLLAMLGQDVGFPVPAGGAARIIDALVARLRSRGGEIICGERVDRVLVRGGRATGVRLASGEVVEAARAVLADVPAPVLFGELVGAEHLPARFVADLRAFQWDHSTVKVDWALSEKVPWSNPAAGEAGTVHIGADLNGLSQYSCDLVSGRVPEAPFLLVGQMTTADPDRSPPGTECVWAYTHVPRGERWGEPRLRAHADRIEAVLERHAPGFGARVVGRAINGPDELHRENPGLIDGAINAGTCAPHQSLIFRPVPGLGRPDTPVDGLFLAGASAHPGGGVHGACGANAAKAALARHGRAGRLYAAGVRLAHRKIYPG